MSSSRTAEGATLYVVPTPLGNLGDVTLRALSVLGSSTLVAAEDTRRTARLLAHHGIEVPTVSLHRFSEERSAGRVLEVLASGGSVAYVTDSGTPGISDPGARLVRRARAAGFCVIPLPGPSAPATALSASGWEGPFTFEGFIERRDPARRAQIERVASSDHATVLFEAPTRLAATLGILAEVAPGHLVLMAREMTKVHEEYRVDTARALLESLPDRVRGEITLVVMPRDRHERRPAGALDAARVALALESEGVRLKRACRIISTLAGLPASAIYETALERRR
jgi:16S rRNA (cytidine1402-2'-O)-methyltransferase